MRIKNIHCNWIPYNAVYVISEDLQETHSYKQHFKQQQANIQTFSNMLEVLLYDCKVFLAVYIGLIYM